KKLVGLEERVSFLLPIEITDILFSDKEVVNEDFSEISSEEENLFDQDIDFNALALELKNINN
ncbi:16977_t:CDS:1, partial [Cetraspora pellucida]